MSEQAVDSFILKRNFDLPGGEWFQGAGLGMFIHWDHASIQGVEIGWPVTGSIVVPGSKDPNDTISVEQYHSTAEIFNPVNWDATAVAKLAKRAGVRYAVFTARHHAGYNMFHTKHSDYGIEHSPFKRDVTKEYVDAIRAEGIRVGFYYSLPDWAYPDYPRVEMSDRPYPGGANRLEKYRRPTPEQWERYKEYLRGQLTELLTNYGQVDLLWFDGEWERTEEEWDTPGLRKLIKSLQPNVVINDRLKGQGDYSTPEQGLPVEAPDGPWELCMTIGQVWQWNPRDTNYKTPRYLVNTLIDAVSRGGNFLLNIGPKGDGSLADIHLTTMNAIGEWMDKHEESVIGVSPTTGVEFYGPTTARPGKLYLHLVMQPVEQFTVRNIPIDRIKKIRLLATGQELPYTTNINVHGSSSRTGERFGDALIEAPVPSGALVDVVAIDFE